MSADEKPLRLLRGDSEAHATGIALSQLRAHIEAALKIGSTREQIIVTILQMTFYAGGVATSNAMRVAGEVFRDIAEREQRPG
jgi:alkylhydroperoxidase/carboxymuconolactone decarboxylase family protein YurZ